MEPGRAGLTRRGWALLGVAVALAVAAFLFGIKEFYPVAVAAAVLVAACRAWVASRSCDVAIVRHVRPARVPAGGSARVELAVANHGARSSPILAAQDPFDRGRRWARFLIAPLAPGEMRWAAYTLPTARRGVFELGPLDLELSDPFGLARVMTIGSPVSTLTVHPRVDPIRSRHLPVEADPDLRVPLPVLGQIGDEFYGLREYRTGDDLRRVHWASTARTDQLMIRQPENLLQGRLTVAVDLRTAVHDASTLEAVLSAAASVVMAGIRNRIQVRLVTTTGVDSGFGATPAHGAAVLDLLAEAQAEPGSTLLQNLHIGAGAGPLTLITTQGSTTPEVTALTAVRPGPHHPRHLRAGRRRWTATDPRPPGALPAGSRAGRQLLPGGVGGRLVLTLGDRPQPASRPPGSPAPIPSSPPARPVYRPTADAYPGATVALLGLTIASALGLIRVFTGHRWLAPVLVTAVGVHAVCWVTRRVRLPQVAALLVGLVAIWVLAGWTVLGSTTVYGFPGAHTATQLWTSLHQARTDFASAVTPTPATREFTLVAVLGTGVVALLGDWAAFRWRSALYGTVPAFVYFVACCTLGAGPGRQWSVVAEVVALLAFLLAHGASVGRADQAWFGNYRSGTFRWALRAGSVAAALALLAAVAVTPLVGKSEGRGLFGWRGGIGSNGSGPRQVPNPVVDLHTRLLQESDVPVFTVQSSVPSYWRLTSLDTFTGQDWVSTNSYRSFGPRLPGTQAVPPGTRVVHEQFVVEQLDSVWLPDAFTPLAVTGVRNVSYDATSGSLITSHPTSDGLTYSVDSYQYISALSVGQLQSAPAVSITSSLRRYIAAASCAGRRHCPGAQHHRRQDHRVRQGRGPAELFPGCLIHLQPGPTRRRIRHRLADEFPVQHPHRVLPAVRWCLRRPRPRRRIADPSGCRVRDRHPHE